MANFWTNYFTGRCYYDFLPGDESKPTVILVHGLIHRGIIFRNLGLWFNRRGFPVWIYDYQTTRSRVPVHGKRFAAFLQELPGEGDVHLVTHSMGGLLTRVALKELEGTSIAGRIKRIAMLAPPHKGSPVATNFCWFPLFNAMVNPLPDLSDRPEAACHALPGIPARYEVGIVAGDRDEKVPLDSTFLDGIKDHIVVSSRHSSIMNKREAREQALHFLENGCFRH